MTVLATRDDVTTTVGAVFNRRGRAHHLKVGPTPIQVGSVEWRENDPITGTSDYRCGIANPFSHTDGITFSTIPWIEYADVTAAQVAADRAAAVPSIASFSSYANLAATAEYAVVLVRVAAVTSGTNNRVQPANTSASWVGDVVDAVAHSGAYMDQGSSAFDTTSANVTYFTFRTRLSGLLAPATGWRVGSVSF